MVNGCNIRKDENQWCRAKFGGEWTYEGAHCVHLGTSLLTAGQGPGQFPTSSYSPLVLINTVLFKAQILKSLVLLHREACKVQMSLSPEPQRKREDMEFKIIRCSSENICMPLFPAGTGSQHRILWGWCHCCTPQRSGYRFTRKGDKKVEFQSIIWGSHVTEHLCYTQPCRSSPPSVHWGVEKMFLLECSNYPSAWGCFSEKQSNDAWGIELSA